MEYPTFVNWTSSFPLKGMLSGNFHLIQILIELMLINSGDPDQTPHDAVSADLNLHVHCIPMSHKMNPMLSNR